MISIIIATYNRKNLLVNSIESILAQTYKNWELIIVDDGSADGTSDLFKEKYKDPRIIYLKLDKNRGATFARNYGLDRIRGEYFLVWDSDDIMYPEALFTVREVFDVVSGLAVVSAPALTFRDGKEVRYPRVSTGILSKEDVLCRILPPSNDKIKLVKTHLCGNVRYKSKNIDFLVNVEFGKHGGWWHIDKYLGEVYVESDNSSLTAARRKPNSQASIERARYLYDYLLEYGPLMKERHPEQFSAFAYGTSLGLILSGRKGEARMLAWESLVQSRRNPKYWALWFLTFLPLAKQILTVLFSLKSALIKYLG